MADDDDPPPDNPEPRCPFTLAYAWPSVSPHHLCSPSGRRITTPSILKPYVGVDHGTLCVLVPQSGMPPRWSKSPCNGPTGRSSVRAFALPCGFASPRSFGMAWRDARGGSHTRIPSGNSARHCFLPRLYLLCTRLSSLG